MNHEASKTGWNSKKILFSIQTCSETGLVWHFFSNTWKEEEEGKTKSEEFTSRRSLVLFRLQTREVTPPHAATEGYTQRNQVI